MTEIKGTDADHVLVNDLLDRIAEKDENIEVLKVALETMRASMRISLASLGYMMGIVGRNNLLTEEVEKYVADQVKKAEEITKLADQAVERIQSEKTQ